MPTTTTRDNGKTVPSPKTLTTPMPMPIPTEGRTRRLSLNIPNPPIRTPPLPVPTRQGSIHRQGHRTSFSTSINTNINSPQDKRQGSSLSLSFSSRTRWTGNGSGNEQEKFEDDGFLKIQLGDIGRDEGGVVSGDEGMERAVEVLLQSGRPCLLVDIGKGEYAFFDFSDLNVFLLLVLQAASSSPSLGPTGSGDRRGHIIKLLRSGGKIPISSVCKKNPCNSFSPTSTLRDLIPLLGSGVHRVLLTTSPPSILSSSNVLEYLVSSQNPPKFFSQTFTSPSLDIPLHPLISLYDQGSVLDAMQVMSLNNLSALGVLGESAIRHRRSSSSSSNSNSNSTNARHIRVGSSSSSSFTYKPPSRSGSQVFSSPSIQPYSPGLEFESPFTFDSGGELINVITAEGCGRLVVPSQGREALSMGLGEATKRLQVIECAGQERGEERVPVHTITCASTILHASHLILATSSFRVFLRNPNMAQSPSLSPAIPSPPSPSIPISSLSLSDSGFPFKEKEKEKERTGLPIPPPTSYSPHYVVSITDILRALGRVYRVNGITEIPNINAVGGGGGIDKLGMKVESDHEREIGKAGTGAGEGGGFESWKWAKEQGQETGKAIA